MANKQPYAQGAQVEHGKFGLGSVLSCTDDYVVIKFDDHGEKKFVSFDRFTGVEEKRSSAPGREETCNP